MTAAPLPRGWKAQAAAMALTTTAPPTGTVTFLFTDVEGSTRRAQLDPRAWAAAQARHHALLFAAIEANGGYVFKTVGDAVCAAFDEVGPALAAALAAQHALAAEAWP